MDKLPLFYDADMLHNYNIRHYINWWLTQAAHMLLVGPTGSGKTFGLKIVMARIGLYLPDAKIWLCDFKNDDFRGFMADNRRYFGFTNCATGLNEFYQAFEARQQGKDDSRSSLFLCFDEWASFLTMLDKKEAEDAKQKLSTLLMLGRSYNVHVLISQQRADAEYFSKARDNFSAVVAMGIITKESAAMFGFDRSEMKPVKGVGMGHMLVHGTELYSIQVPIVRDTEKLDRAILHAISR
ncbi:MAG: hypothetical protein KBI01_10020 [Oscillospiraceae bacterium]|nr:hypothetical protein [Oscillospiraceae bacterium]